MRNLVLLPLAAFLLTHCGASKKEEQSTVEGDVKGTIPDVGTIIIDLPSAVAPTTGGLKLAEEGGDLKKLFLLPVALTGVAESMTTLTKGVIEHLFGKAVCLDNDSSNDAADCDEYRGIISGQISETATVFEVPGSAGDDSPSHVKYWANPEGSAYDVSIELYWAGAEGFVPALTMQLSKTGDEQGKGEFTFFPNFDGSSTDGPEIIVSQFEATDARKTMDLQLYLNEENGPESFGLKLTEEKGVITGAGVAIRAELTADTGDFAPFDKKEEFAYIYTLAADAANNIAVEKIAAVTAANYAAESSFFTSYGVDGLIRNFAIDLLRGASSNFNCATSGQYISAALPANICASNSAVTDADVLTGLTSFCSSNASSPICLIAGQTSRWSNPIYLDANGYVGTEVYQKPSDANYAPLAEALNAVTAYTPTTLKALTRPVLPDAVETVE